MSLVYPFINSEFQTNTLAEIFTRGSAMNQAQSLSTFDIVKAILIVLPAALFSFDGLSVFVLTNDDTSRSKEMA